MSENIPPGAPAAGTPSTAAATTPATPSAPANAASDTPSKLTGAQLKAQKKAEKAARRGQVVATKSAVEVANAASGNDSSKGGAKQNKGKQENAATPNNSSTGRGPKKTGPTTVQAPTQPPKPKGPEVPDMFSYLAMAKKMPMSRADKDVHPAILAIGQQMASFTLTDNLARVEAMLAAFRIVIEAHEPPPGQTFARNILSACLNPQIEYLTGCRTMCFSMGNAIRMLKSKINTLVENNTSDEESKETLIQAIQTFLQERVLYAEVAIAKKATTLIHDGDRILTYGQPRLVRLALQRAWAEGRQFEVAIVDDPFDRAGQELAKILRQDGINIHYYPSLAGISMNIRRVSKVILGAEAMFANGSLYAQAGTADLALAAKDADIPVIALLETVNCDRERVSVDSLTYNEIDPEKCAAGSFRLLFDTTRDRYISMVVTESEEAEASGSTSAILSILKKLDEKLDVSG